MKKNIISTEMSESDIRTNEANLKLQEAFYGEGDHQVTDVPTYINNNTASIKITGNDK